MAETAPGRDESPRAAHTTRHLSRQDLVAATLLGLTLAATFWWLSPGWSLRVTFVPAMLLTVALIHWWARTDVQLPDLPRLLPTYCAALALQLLHFAEEYATGFATRFPHRYGGPAIDPTVFVGFNMTAYAVFLLSTVAVTTGRGPRALLVPSLFYVIYGAIGNALAHIAWALEAGGYFPGLITGSLYVLIGPALLKRYWSAASWSIIATTCAVLATLMLPPILLIR